MEPSALKRILNSLANWDEDDASAFRFIAAFVIVICLFIVGEKALNSIGGIDGAIDKWYANDKAKCLEKSPVYGNSGTYWPYWDIDEHECMMLTRDSIYARDDARMIRERLKK